MPKDRHLHGGSRQRPVSCRFCRSRKLRCSREAPCSNCVSRGIRCDLEQPTGLSPEALSTLEPEIIERIRKLEELVAKQESQQNENAKQAFKGSDTQVQRTGNADSSTPITHLDYEVAWLESIYSGHGASFQDKMPSQKVFFRTCPIKNIMEAQSYINQSVNLASTRLDPLRCVWLPQYPEAKILVAKYIKDIDHIHHVIHSTSLSTILDEVYACLGQQGQVKTGYMILLLSMFASCTHSWVQRDCELGIFSTEVEANIQSPFWIKATEDLLDIAHRTTSVSIEGIQGIIITSFVLGNIEGFTRSFRSLYNMALFLARDLGLHFLDHPSNAHLANSAQAEIGRRIWWYLVASDWLIAGRLCDIAQGDYQCHVRHMLVKKPLNIDDEDVVDGMSRIEKPLYEPTVMSYSLQRIRLSEISRSIVDHAPLMMAHAGGLSYDMVMGIDSELQMLINDIPPFFSMSTVNIAEKYQFDLSKAARIAHQGYMLHSHIYTQRCKLHFPYFSRGFVNSTYAPSRELCLQSARLVIQTETQVEVLGLCIATRYRFLGLLLGVFIATIILFMDLCHNKLSPLLENPQGEIADAFRILEEARHDSKTAAKFLDSLMHLLRKHKVQQPKRAENQHLRPGISSEHHLTVSSGADDFSASILSNSTCAVASTPSNSMSLLGDNEEINTEVARGEDLSLYFNDLAQSFEHGVDVGSFDWNSIFLGIDSSFN